jgi:hypothetical protein
VPTVNPRKINHMSALEVIEQLEALSLDGVYRAVRS